MDLFYKGHDPAAPVTSGAQHLSAAAARFALSIVRSIPQLPEAAWVEFQRLLTVDALWSLCLILAGWVLATVVGGFIGLAVNALLIAYGLVELWEQIQDVGHALRQWAVTAYEATTETALDDVACEFPIVDPRRALRRHRHSQRVRATRLQKGPVTAGRVWGAWYVSAK